MVGGRGHQLVDHWIQEQSAALLIEVDMGTCVIMLQKYLTFVAGLQCRIHHDNSHPDNTYTRLYQKYEI